MALTIIAIRARIQRRRARLAALERRYLRDHSNIFDMPEQEFIDNFRMDKQCFKNLLEEVSPFIPSFKSTAVPSVIKLATFLRFIGNGSYQQGLGDEITNSISQEKVCQIIAQLLDIFERHICPKYIRFEMSEQEEVDMKGKFYQKFGLPSIVGCVDGMHVKIKAPTADRHLYYNRMGFYSVNTIIICDYDMVIRYVDARQGATHDSDLWRTSEADGILKSAYMSGKQNTWLLGDSGFPLLPYLLTPYRQPQSREAVNFNNKLRKARSIIERCLGILKNRFQSITNEKRLHYSPVKCAQIVKTCCALHNKCIYRGNNWEYVEEMYTETPEDTLNDEEPTSPSAAAIRDEIAEAIL